MKAEPSPPNGAPRAPERRRWLGLAGAALGLAALAPRRLLANAVALPTRVIPCSGERIPVVGLGTWQSFDVPPSGAAFEAASRVLARFLDLGGRVVDTSPMYGRAEAALGEIAAASAANQSLFLSTKLWTTGRAFGRRQLDRSLELLRRQQLDLVQVHNMRDLEAQLEVLEEARSLGQVRHVGISHYQADSHPLMQRMVESGRVDVLQVNYSLAEPQAGSGLLDACADHGVAVLVNRAFQEGAMFSRVGDRPLPPVAADIGATSHAQVFLKWILGHPAVTCALTGTRNEEHIAENLSAATTPLPDPRQRNAIADWFATL